MDGDTGPGAKSRETGIEQMKALIEFPPSLHFLDSFLPFLLFLLEAQAMSACPILLSKWGLVGCFSGPRTLPTRQGVLPFLPEKEGTGS